MSEQAGGGAGRKDRRRRGGERARPDRCPNCDTPLTDQYCPHCGQNNRVARLRLREMLGAAFEHLFELDLPIVRTFVGLAIRPGRVCLDYVQGRRRRYTNPLRYFILLGAMYVLVLVTFDISPSRSVQRAFTPSASATPAAETAPPPAGDGAEPGASADDTAPEPSPADADDGERGQRVAAYFREHGSRRVEESINFIWLAAVPFLALAYRVLFRRPRYTFAEHLVFVLFIYAQDLAIRTVGALMGLHDTLAGVGAGHGISAAYMTWAACVFYRAGVVTTLLRILLVFAWYVVVVGILGAIYLALWMLWLFSSGTIWERI